MKIMSGNSNLPLARAIAGYLELPLTDAAVRRFADEEIFVEIHENVRGEDVFVVQPTSYPVNDNLMELLICIDALRRASAKRITAVIPYFGYARQDRKPGPRTPISAKLVANLLTEAGADRVLSVDLHAGQIQGFFDIPTDNLFAAPVMAADIQARYGDQSLMVVSPDVGGVVRARALAKRLDNIIDSGGTLCNAAQALMDEGAASVTAYITHGVLSGAAVSRVTNSALKELVITDSIMPTDAAKASDKIRILPIAPLLGEAIRRIADESSVSSLFD
jgi:ribose-phosphate pyrophosphokinase